MNIDVSNKWLMMLLRGADLSDGCSVIRHAIFKSIFVLGAAVVALVVGCVLVLGIVGFVLYLFAPWFGTLDIWLSLSYLGNSWLAELTRVTTAVCMVIGVMLSFVFLIIHIGDIWEFVTGWLTKDRPMLQAVKQEVKQSVTYKMVASPFVAVGFLARCVSDLAHAICPVITIQGDPVLKRMVNDTDVYVVLDRDPDVIWLVRDHEAGAVSIEFSLKSVETTRIANGKKDSIYRNSNVGRRSWVCFYVRSGTWDEPFHIVDAPKRPFPKVK